jgi:putative salt-induced outer membrane protein YdiY
VLPSDPPNSSLGDDLERPPSSTISPLAALVTSPEPTPAAGGSTTEPPLLIPSIGLEVPIQDPAPKPPETERERWSGNFALGATFTDGNSVTKNASATAEIVRRGDDNRFTAKGGWLYAEQKATNPTTGATFNNITDRWLYGSGQYDHFITEKWYGFVNVRGEGSKAPNLTFRLTTGAGLGHQIAETDELKLAVEAGLSYVHEDYRAASPTEYVAARVANTMNYQVSANTTYEHAIEWLPSLEDGDDQLIRYDGKLRINLTEKMFAQAQVIWDWDNTPARGLGRTDTKFILGIGWSF